MKHMWSEEEIQALIEEQGGSGGSNGVRLDDIVDSQGHKRFIAGIGTPEIVSGMSIAYSKWVLNGTNLIFEILGTFSNDLIGGNNLLCTFTIPEWIVPKIQLAYNDIIDFIEYNITSLSGGTNNAKLQISITGNTIYFNNVSVATINGLCLFRIHYNTIIDNE